MGNIGFEKQNQRKLNHVRIQQMTCMLCEKILSDIKNDLMCFMNTEHFYPFPRTEPRVRVVMI